jgi:hypothetical protein
LFGGLDSCRVHNLENGLVVLVDHFFVVWWRLNCKEKIDIFIILLFIKVRLG